MSKTIRRVLALQIQFLPTRRLPLITNASSAQTDQTLLLLLGAIAQLATKRLVTVNLTN